MVLKFPPQSNILFREDARTDCFLGSLVFIFNVSALTKPIINSIFNYYLNSQYHQLPWNHLNSDKIKSISHSALINRDLIYFTRTLLAFLEPMETDFNFLN